MLPLWMSFRRVSIVPAIFWSKYRQSLNLLRTENSYIMIETPCGARSQYRFIWQLYSCDRDVNATTSYQVLADQASSSGCHLPLQGKHHLSDHKAQGVCTDNSLLTFSGFLWEASAMLSTCKASNCYTPPWLIRFSE